MRCLSFVSASLAFACVLMLARHRTQCNTRRLLQFLDGRGEGRKMKMEMKKTENKSKKKKTTTNRSKNKKKKKKKKKKMKERKNRIKQYNMRDTIAIK